MQGQKYGRRGTHAAQWDEMEHERDKMQPRHRPFLRENGYLCRHEEYFERLRNHRLNDGFRAVVSATVRHRADDGQANALHRICVGTCVCRSRAVVQHCKSHHAP